MSETTVTILLDGEPVVLSSDTVTGRDIKIAGRVDPSRSLWVEGPANCAINDDERVAVVDGARFMSVPAGMF